MLKKATKKLFISSLALAFAAATAISASFAWFTVQTKTSVTGIELNVTTGEGFEIRFGGPGATDSDYKQTLKLDDFKKAYPAYFKDGSFKLRLDHVSMVYRENVEVAMAKLGDDGKLVLLEDELEDDRSYLKFELFFRARVDYNIILNADQTSGWSKGMSMAVPSVLLDDEPNLEAYIASVTGPEGFENRDKEPITYGDPMYAFAADAARVSLMDLTPEVQVIGDKEDVNLVEKFSEPTIVKFTDITNDDGYGDAYPTDKTDPSGHRNLALDLYNAITGKDLEVPTKNTETEIKVGEKTYKASYFLPKAKTPAELRDEDEDVIVSLQDGYNPGVTGEKDDLDNNLYYGKLEVRIWLEGWDGDCFNAIFGDTLTVNLGFQAVRKED